MISSAIYYNYMRQLKSSLYNVILQGVSRDRIAADNDIGAGTVSNIIDEWKKGVLDSDYESIRELSVFCKKQEVTLNAFASCIRLNNYIEIALNPMNTNLWLNAS